MYKLKKALYGLKQAPRARYERLTTFLLAKGFTRGQADRTLFVSIFASFCVWTKSLMCKDAVKRDSTCQSIFRRLWTAKKIEDFRFPVSRSDDMSSRPDDMFITTGRQTDQHHPSGRRIFSVQTLHCIEKFLFQLASVRTSQQPVRTSISDQSASDSFQVQYMGRSTSTVRTMWFPIRTQSKIRQESQFKCHRPDVS